MTKKYTITNLDTDNNLVDFTMIFEDNGTEVANVPIQIAWDDFTNKNGMISLIENYVSEFYKGNIANRVVQTTPVDTISTDVQELVGQEQVINDQPQAPESEPDQPQPDDQTQM